MIERNPICVKCRVELTWVMDNVVVSCNGINDDLDFILIGTQYKCKKCGATIVSNFGERFSSVTYDQNYLKKLKDGAGESIELI